jgi:hypothetical protein
MLSLHRFIAALILLPASLRSQSTTGTLLGKVVDSSGRPVFGTTVTITGHPAAFRLRVSSDTGGAFEFVLPYGDYEIAAGSASPITLHIYALGTMKCTLRMADPASSAFVKSHSSCTPSPQPFEGWQITPSTIATYAGPYSVPGLLLSQEPTLVTQPLDYTGVNGMRLPVHAQRAFTWTGTLFQLQGMNATDPYQPGHTLILPDVQSIDEVAVRSGLALGASPAFASVVDVYAAQAQSALHASLFIAGTGSAFASDNLPDPATRNKLQQAQHFRWLTRDHFEIGTPIGRRMDLFASGAGQWSSQTIPIASPSQDQNGRLLFGHVRSHLQLSAKDQLDSQYTGSRINLSNWAEPAGLEALLGRRAAPSFDTSFGFKDLAETDHLDFLQVGWTRQLVGASYAGVIQVRYQFSTAHLDTSPVSAPGAQSITDLRDGTVTGAPPLANLAVRTRQELGAVFEPDRVQFAAKTHRPTFGADWTQSKVRNRFNAPSGLNLITAAGTPAFALLLNTPLDSRERIHWGTVFARDDVRVSSWLSASAGLLLDSSRGSLPRQSSPAGPFTPARAFAARSAVIDWTSVSPYAGIALAIPSFPGLVFRAAYRRSYQPLAGRYVDYANPNSLGGLAYQWNDVNRDGRFEPPERGALLNRFGGPYSSISPSLDRPYADEFNVGASVSLPLHFAAGIELYRRDEKHRLATINSGVPPSSFTPITIIDPGPDGMVGTFDDQHLTLYQQNSSTRGRDEFLLTNPRGLRMQYEGLTAQLETRHRYIDFRASFTAEKSFGPTNPGDGVLENDPGVIGALYQDPNTSINAAGRDFFDRAFVGKIATVSQLPRWLGGLNMANVVDYLDGLVFARRLLVNGFTQGPFLVNTTVRGSPEGGNRAEFMLNWNLRLARRFELPFGQLVGNVDLLNVTNAGNRIQESYASGPAFNQRLPIAVQPPRQLGIGVEYDF